MSINNSPSVMDQGVLTEMRIGSQAAEHKPEASKMGGGKPRVAATTLGAST